MRRRRATLVRQPLSWPIFSVHNSTPSLESNGLGLLMAAGDLRLLTEDRYAISNSLDYDSSSGPTWELKTLTCRDVMRDRVKEINRLNGGVISVR